MLELLFDLLRHRKFQTLTSSLLVTHCMQQEMVCIPKLCHIYGVWKAVQFWRVYSEVRHNQNHQNSEVTMAKETIKCKMFLHFHAFEHVIRRNQPEFSMVWSGPEKYHPIKKERVFLANTRKPSDDFLLHAACCQLLKISMAQEVKKAFYNFDYWELSIFFKRISRNEGSFFYLPPRIV